MKSLGVGVRGASSGLTVTAMTRVPASKKAMIEDLGGSAATISLTGCGSAKPLAIANEGSDLESAMRTRSNSATQARYRDRISDAGPLARM